jgi:hypothetical protein
MAFLDRLLRKRVSPYDITGFAGGSLGDQLDQSVDDGQQPQQPAPQPTGQLLTPTNQANITRPRTVNPFQQRLLQQPASGTVTSDPNAPFGSSGQPFSPTRDRRTQPRDVIADDSQYLQDIVDKPDRLRDKLGLVSQSISRSLGGQPLPTRKQHAEEQAAATLGRDMAVQRQQILNRQSQMVPIYNAAGDVIGMAPAKSSATTQINANRLNETQRRNDAYIGHLNDLPGEKQAEAARKMWMSGVADGNPDLKAELGKRMGIKEELPDTDKGKVEVNADGNYIVVHPRSGNVTDVTQPVPQVDRSNVPPDQQVRPRTAATPVVSFQQTQEQNRQGRFQQGEQNKDTRQQRGIAAADQRQQTGIAATNLRLGDPQQMYDKASQMWDEAQAKRAEAKGLGRREAGMKIREAEQLENQTRQLQRQGDRAKAAMGGTAPQTTDKPTKSLSAIRAAAQAKNLDPDEAERRARARTDITLIP